MRTNLAWKKKISTKPRREMDAVNLSNPAFVHGLSGLPSPAFQAQNCITITEPVSAAAAKKESSELKTISTTPGNSFKLAMNN